MKEKDEMIFVTDDQGKKLDQTDKEVMNAAASGEGTIEIKSAEQLMELAHLAHETFQKFRVDVNKIMTPERAKIVRDLRVQDYSWRAIARECHAQFNGTWQPESNQLAGMALCEAAAEHFGENYRDEFWNNGN